MIVAVAIKYDGRVWVMGRPHRHHHIRHWIYLEIKEHGTKLRPYVDMDTAESLSIEGFLDQDGNFLDRSRAMEEARVCGQLRKEYPLDNEWLFSENLW